MPTQLPGSRIKMERPPVDDQARIVRSRHAPPKKNWHVQAAIVDEAELGQLARLVARLTPGQQRLVVALPMAFGGVGWSRSSGERAWRGSDLSDEGVLSDARTWLARRPGKGLDRGDKALPADRHADYMALDDDDRTLVRAPGGTVAAG